MSDIVKILTKEKELNSLLDAKHSPDNITEQLSQLFDNPLYASTAKWLNNENNGMVLSLHDTCVSKFSERRDINEYKISFNIASMPIYKDKEQVGFLSHSEFKIKSSGSLREMSEKCLLNFLIDEKNQKIAFLFLFENKPKIIGLPYTEIEFIKGVENIYPQNKKLKM